MSLDVYQKARLNKNTKAVMQIICCVNVDKETGPFVISSYLYFDKDNLQASKSH